MAYNHDVIEAMKLIRALHGQNISEEDIRYQVREKLGLGDRFVTKALKQIKGQLAKEEVI